MGIGRGSGRAAVGAVHWLGLLCEVSVPCQMHPAPCILHVAAPKWPMALTFSKGGGCQVQLHAAAAAVVAAGSGGGNTGPAQLAVVATSPVRPPRHSRYMARRPGSTLVELCCTHHFVGGFYGVAPHPCLQPPGCGRAPPIAASGSNCDCRPGRPKTNLRFGKATGALPHFSAD